MTNNVCSLYKMDPNTFTLLVTQALLLVLLIISETLPLSASPYSGIIQALIVKLQEIKTPSPKPLS
jgi:hypothetical protein